VNNAAIKAWQARTFKAGLEYYFEGVGLLAVSAFQREIENFFGNTVFRATPEFLALYGLAPSVYDRYDVATQHNLADTARMSGVDVTYKQALTFLPHWARGVQVFANGSSLRTTGPAAANFAGFVPRTASWGASLTRPKYNVRLRWTHAGRARRGAVAAGRGIEASTYNWASSRTMMDLNGEYRVHQRVTLFGNLTNLNDAPVDLEIAGPSTPAHAQLRQRQQWGAVWTFGVRGTF
jgi:outer membrane receptor protein involved in Fe transport